MTPRPAAAAASGAGRVLLDGNGLPARWAGRRVFQLVEVGFGDGHGFLAAWRAWRADPLRCGRLSVLVIEPHPPDADRLRAAHGDGDATVDALLAAWPCAVPGLHRRAFDDGCVELLLAVGSVAEWARERVGAADAFHLGGAAVDVVDPGWDPRLLQALLRRCSPDATVSSASTDPRLHAALSAAGFVVATRHDAADGTATTVGTRRATPAPTPLDGRRPAWPAPAPAPSALPGPSAGARPLAGRRVAVVGAGLAGCATAHALVQAGAEVHLFDRHPTPAAETSGNPAGLVHPVFHHPDTPHARLHRAAALDARVAIDAAAATAALPHGRGLLRLARADTADADRSALATSGLPAAFVRWLDAPAVDAATGLSLGRPGWWFPDGGWVSPTALCAAWLHQARETTPGAGRGRLHWRAGEEVASIEPVAEGRWRVALAAPSPGADAPDAAAFDAVVVAAAGVTSLRLVAPHADVTGWPVEPVRGQLLGLPAGSPGVRPPVVAVTGFGYALPPLDGTVWVGATADAGDADASVRAADRAALLDRAASMGLVGADTGPADVGPVADRCGVRWRTDDRLPLIGPVPAPAADGRADQPRFVRRVPGLYLFTALGSRGIAWAHWGAQVLVSGMAGSACPVASSLLDRVDPARFRVRTWRRPVAMSPAPAPMPTGVTTSLADAAGSDDVRTRRGVGSSEPRRHRRRTRGGPSGGR